MQRSIRQKLIVQTVRGSGRIRIDQLAELTGASAVTIRRDLAELEAHGSLRRTRGGAARAAKFGEEVSYRIRAGEDQQAKARLAETAAALINDYDSLIIDNGTTCHAVAHELAGRPVTALCLSLHVAAALAAVPGARVIVPGGPVEPDTLALYGSQAIDAVRAISADVLLIGACSVSATRGLTSATYEDAQLKRASIHAASKTILVATGAKLNQTSNFRFGAAADIARLITTADAPGRGAGRVPSRRRPPDAHLAGLVRRAASPAAGQDAREEPSSWERTGEAPAALAGLQAGATLVPRGSIAPTR